MTRAPMGVLNFAHGAFLTLGAYAGWELAAHTGNYLPETQLAAADLALLTAIPESVLIDKFGLRGKHVAADDQRVTDLAIQAARRLLAEQHTDPETVDAVTYFGSTWKDYAVWQAAPRIAHALGCSRAFALELDYTSCGSPVALRVAKALGQFDSRIRTTLLVAASCESRLVDYTNERTRFMFSFGDGAVAALVETGHEILESSMLTDGSLSLHVRLDPGEHYLDVHEPDAMRRRLAQVSLDNFLQVAADAVKQSGLALTDVDFLLPIHMKRSMHHELLTRLALTADQTVYLDDTGHMSGVDNLLALDRLSRAGSLADGDIVLLLAAGVGYTWAATVIRWAQA